MVYLMIYKKKKVEKFSLQFPMFCLTNSPKCENIRFTIIEKRKAEHEKDMVFCLEKLFKGLIDC